MMMELPDLGLGTASLGNLYREVSDEEANALLTRAWQLGVRYFDTAPYYGFSLSEVRLGEFLKDKPRAEFWLSSKVGRRLVAVDKPPQNLGFVATPNFKPVFDYSGAGIDASIKSSLKRLGTDTLDIAFIHDIGALTHGSRQAEHLKDLLGSGMRQLSRLKAEGVIGAIGLGVNEVAICLELLGKIELDYILMAGRYSLLEQGPLDSLFKSCAKHDCKLIIGGAFNSGILARPLFSELRHGAKAISADKFDYVAAKPEVIKKVDRLEAYCHQRGVALAAAAIQFPSCHHQVVSLLMGAAKVEEFMQCLEYIDTSLPPGFWSGLKSEKLIDLRCPIPDNL